MIVKILEELSVKQHMKLSATQLQNWRTVLVGIIGPYALIMSDEDIQAYCDAVQYQLDLEDVQDNVKIPTESTVVPEQQKPTGLLNLGSVFNNIGL